MVVPPTAAVAPSPRVVAPPPGITKAHAECEANAEASSAAPPTIAAPIGAWIKTIVTPARVTIETPPAVIGAVTRPVAIGVWVAAVGVPGVVVGDV